MARKTAKSRKKSVARKVDVSGEKKALNIETDIETGIDANIETDIETDIDAGIDAEVQADIEAVVGADIQSCSMHTAAALSANTLSEMARILDALQKQGYRLGKLKNLSKLEIKEARALFETFISAVALAEELGDKLAAAAPFLSGRKVSGLRNRLKNPLEAHRLVQEINSLEEKASARYEQMLLEMREFQARGYAVEHIIEALNSGKNGVQKMVETAREAFQEAEPLRSRFEALDHNSFPQEAAQVRAALADLKRIDWAKTRIQELENLSNTRGRDLEERIASLDDRGFDTGRLSLARGLDLITMESWVNEYEDLAARRPELENRLKVCDFSSWPGLLDELGEILPDPYRYEELDNLLETHEGVVAQERDALVRKLASMGEEFTGRDSSAIAQANVETLRGWASDSGEAFRVSRETLEALDKIDTTLFGALAEKVRQLASRRETVSAAAAELSILRSRVQGAESALEREIEAVQESGYSVYLLVESAGRDLATRFAGLEEIRRRVAGLQEVGGALEKLDTSLFIEEGSLLRASLKSPEDLEMIQARFGELQESVRRVRQELEREIATLGEQGCDVSSLESAMEENDLFYARNAVEGFRASMNATDSLRQQVLAMRCDSLAAECDAILESLRDPSMASCVADRVEGLSQRADARRESFLGRISDLAASGFVVDFISLAAMDLDSLEKAFREISLAVTRADDLRDRLDALDTSCHITSADRIRKLLRRPSEVRAASVALERLEAKVQAERQELVDKVRELATMGFSVGSLMTIVQEKSAIHARAAILDFNVKADTARAMMSEISLVDSRTFPTEARQLEGLARDPGRLEELRELLHTVRVRERTRIAEVESEAASLREEGFIFPDLPEGSLFDKRQALNGIRESVSRARSLMQKLSGLDTTLFTEASEEVSRSLTDISRLRDGRLALVELESRIRGARRELDERVALYRRRGYAVDSLPLSAPMAQLSASLDGFASSVMTLEAMARELEALDTSLFPSEKLRVLKELRDPSAMERAHAEVAGLARRIELEREALAGRVLNLADRGFMVPPVEDLIIDRLSNVTMRVRRLEQSAEEAHRLLTRLDNLDAYPFPEEENRVRGLIMDLTSLPEARAALDTLDRHCREAMERARARVDGYRREGLIVDTLLSSLASGSLRRINESLAGFEENLARLRTSTFRLANFQSRVFQEQCDEIRLLLADPSAVDRVEAALAILEELTGEAFGELATLVEDYRGRGLMVEVLEKALCGDLDTAMETFQSYQADLDHCEELRRTINTADTSIFQEQTQNILDSLKDPSNHRDASARFRDILEKVREEDSRLKALLRGWKDTGFDISSLRGAEVFSLARKKVSYASFADAVENLRDLEAEIRGCADAVDEKVIGRAIRFLRNPARLNDARRLRDEIVKMAETRRNRERRADELSGLLESLDTSIFAEDRDRIINLLRGRSELEKAEASIESLINRINDELKGYSEFIRSMEVAGYDTLRLRRAREEGSTIRELWEMVELFRADVSHLQRLQNQLEGMDTTLFQPQARVIVSKCKSPDLIPEIEDNLANLADMILRKGEAQSSETAEFRQEGFMVSALDEVGLTQAEREERIRGFRVRAGHARGLMGSLKSRDYSPFTADLEALAELCRDPDSLDQAERLISIIDEKSRSFREELEFRTENLLQRGFLVDTADLGDRTLLQMARTLETMEESAARLTDARSRLEALPKVLFGQEVTGLLPFLTDLRAVAPLREALEYLELRYSTMLSVMDSIIQRYGDEGYTTESLEDARNSAPETFGETLADYEKRVSDLMRVRVRLRPLQPEVCMKNYTEKSAVLYDTSRVSEAHELLNEAAAAFQSLKDRRIESIRGFAEKGFMIRDRLVTEFRAISSNEELTLRWEEMSGRIARLSRIQERLSALDCGKVMVAEVTALLRVARDPDRVEEAERGAAGLESALRNSRREMVARIAAMGSQGYSFKIPQGGIDSMTFSDLERLLEDLEDRESRVAALLRDLERYREIPSCAAEVEELSALVRDLSEVGTLEEKFRNLAVKVSQYFRKLMESFEARGLAVESLRMSLSEPVDVIHRVFHRYEAQAREMDRLSEIIASQDNTCYEEELRPVQEMLKDPSLAASAGQALEGLVRRMQSEDEEYDFETQWFTKRGFDTSRLREASRATKANRAKRRALMSEFREKVTRCERYSRVLDSLEAVFSEIDISTEREQLTHPFNIVAFEKRLKSLTAKVYERANMRLSRWKGYGFGWGSLMEGLARDAALFAESFARYEKAAAEAAAYMDAASASRTLSKDPAFKAISLALRNPLALSAVKEELDSLFRSYSIPGPGSEADEEALKGEWGAHGVKGEDR